MSPERSKPRLWPWVAAFLVVSLLAMVCSPILILGMGGCCSSKSDPTVEALIAPAKPLMQIFFDLGFKSIFGFMLAVGLSYGLPVLAIGAVITGLRRAWRPDR